MEIDPKDYDYDSVRKKGTGSHDKLDDYKIIVYPFDQYEISIKLTSTNEFVEVTGIRINKDFLSYKQKISSRGFVDVDEEYPE